MQEESGETCLANATHPFSDKVQRLTFKLNGLLEADYELTRAPEPALPPVEDVLKRVRHRAGLEKPGVTCSTG